MHGRWRSGEVRVEVAHPPRERDGDPGVEAVVVEDADQLPVQRQRADGQRRAGHGEAGAAGSEVGGLVYCRRHSPRGGNRL